MGWHKRTGPYPVHRGQQNRKFRERVARKDAAYERLHHRQREEKADKLRDEYKDFWSQEFSRFRSMYSGVEQDAINVGRQELAARKKLIPQMMDLATPDYEGAVSQAATDATIAAAKSRQDMERQMARMGMVPGNSNAYMAMLQDSYHDEALNKVMGMNRARRGEKERVANLTGQALNAMDGSTLGKGMNIQNLRQRGMGMHPGAKITGVPTSGGGYSPRASGSSSGGGSGGIRSSGGGFRATQPQRLRYYDPGGGKDQYYKDFKERRRQELLGRAPRI